MSPSFHPPPEAQPQQQRASRTVKVAAVQMCATEDVSQNLREVRRLVRRASAAGVQVVTLPENFAYLGATSDHKDTLAEPISTSSTLGTAGTQSIVAQMQTLAAETRVWLLLGSVPERLPDTASRQVETPGAPGALATRRCSSRLGVRLSQRTEKCTFST